MRIEAIDPSSYDDAIEGLGALLKDAIDGGASVNFVAGVTREQTEGWWAARAPRVADGTITVFVARDAGGRIVGSTLIERSANPNSPHRAEIAKVLVHSTARRGGLGRALMDAAEERARKEGRWLLILDTQSGTAAEAFYRALGWIELGTMPNHSYRTDGVLAPTTFFWKDLRG